MRYELKERKTSTAIVQENTLSRKELTKKCYSIEDSKSLLLKKVQDILKMRYIVLLLFTGILTQSIAQITTMGNPVQNEKDVKSTQTDEDIIYDSLKNFEVHQYSKSYKSSYKHLIGQKIYVVNNSDLSQLKRYYWSKTDITNRGWNVEGHFMTIIDGKRYQNNSKWKNAFDIAFQDDSDSIVYCYEKDRCSNINNYMVIVGHYEKVKQLFENKELVFVKDDDKETYYYQNGIFDFDTRKRIDAIKKGTLFSCKGISIDDQKGDIMDAGNPYKNIADRVVILLYNNELGNCFCYATSQDMINGKANNEFILGKFLYPEEYAKMQKNNAISEKQKKKTEQDKDQREQQHIQALVDKYGQSNVNLARQGKVKIGWNKELCIEAWGKPRSVNKTTTAYGVHEQWVYSTSRYLYFDDGILTAIQE